MDIKRGDKVKFLNEAGGGIVIKILEKGQALVQIEDGFELPVMVSELIKVESSGEKENRNSNQIQTVNKKHSEEKKVAEIKPINFKESKQTVKPLLAIVPATEKFDADHAKFDLYLLNDGTLFFYYTLAFESFSRLTLIEKGELEPEMKVKIGTFYFSDLIVRDSIIIDMLSYDEGEYRAFLPVHFVLDLKTMNLLRQHQYIENEYFYEPALVFNLLDKNKREEIDAVSNKDKKDVPAPKPEKSIEETEEVDLHIEEIMDNTSNLSNGEILNIQMARFTTSLEGAMKGKIKKIVFIHGVGNGKLKYELRKTLENKYPDLKFQDASFAEYGYGATMVMIRR